MKIAVAAASLLAFLACVPNTSMSKADFMNCIRQYPDEVRIARKYGIPQTITKYSTGQAGDTEDQTGSTWAYTHNKELFFHFDATGHLIPRSSSKNPNPH